MHLTIEVYHICVQINLSYTSVTDLGLLSLARISCLQNMNILHLKGWTPGGLAAALLACGGLTKVKLQASFKSFLPQALLEHLEARGCVFQWREKMYQVRIFFLLFLLSFFVFQHSLSFVRRGKNRYNQLLSPPFDYNL